MPVAMWASLPLLAYTVTTSKGAPGVTAVTGARASIFCMITSAPVAESKSCISGLA